MRAFKQAIITSLAVICMTLVVCAQSTAPRKPARPIPAGSPQPFGERATAPQVVTIVHRLNGLKMFRLLLRSQEQVEAIAGFDDAFNLTDDVHTNIIAGLAMDDGRTIAAWLPEAEVEFGPSAFSFGPKAPSRKQIPRSPLPPTEQTVGFPFRGGMFGTPDLTVIGPDGKRLQAEYIGLDGATGLSILRLADDNLKVSSTEIENKIDEGENVYVLNPEPAGTQTVAAGSVYVRMGKTNGRVFSIRHAPAGGVVSRFKVRAPRLTLANIGGVAVNDAGETVGIVDAVEGAEATILPTALIQRAARRVLSQHTSVPRPWLGVRGEALQRLGVDQLRSQGWKLDRATSLVERQKGILLTSIAPGSPAAFAALRAGDVILKVNDEDVQSNDDFSWMLDEAGPSSSVTFTLVRPDRVAEEAVRVQLSGLFDPASAFHFSPEITANPLLVSQGIETVALKPPVAVQLGASNGLLIVYVDPASSAFDAGLQPGDVIESINGQPVFTGNESPGFSASSMQPANFEIVRRKQKIVVKVNPPNQKK